MILGTIASIVFSILFLIVAGAFTFNEKVKREKKLLFSSETTTEIINESDLDSFPKLIKNYLLKAGVVGKPKHCSVTFKQNGAIKTDPKKNWLTFKATQYMSSANSGFIWNARAFPIYIRDKYMDGKGEIMVNFLGLRKLVSVSTPEVDQSAFGRYFGELIWFPIGFLDRDIKWDVVDETTIKGIITKSSISFEGYFHFAENGLIDSFRCKRYRDDTLDDFIGEAEGYELMDGLLIPKRMRAIWDLKQGRLEYFNATITEYKLKK